MGRRLGIYTLGHYLSLNEAFEKKLWNPLLQTDERWELCELGRGGIQDERILADTLEGMTLTHEQILRGFFPLPERLSCLERIREEISKSFDNLANILCMELQKPISLAKQECERCLATIDASLEYGKKLLASDPVLRGTGAHFSGESFPSPRRLSLGVTPFNFPLNLSLHKIAPALLAGSPLIWRPSPKAQLSGLALTDVLHAARIPAGLIAYLPMTHDLFWKLLKDPRLEALSFTGSAAVGWQIPKFFQGPIVLELGGAAPIYFEDLGEEENLCALEEILRSAFSFAGQSCISAQSLWIQKSIFENIRSQLPGVLERFPCGPASEANSLCAGLIDEDAAQRVQGRLKRAESEGAIILSASTETARSNAISHFISPCLIERPPQSLLREEIFAPVLCLESIRDFSEFKIFANSLSQRLQCGVYSRDPKVLEEARYLHYGGVSLCGPSSQRVDALPYGGRGAAGLGMECPSENWSFFSPMKTLYQKL